MFDTIVVVDWSSSNSPTPVRKSEDAIWVGLVTKDLTRTSHYFRTRYAAYTFLKDFLLSSVKASQRVLVGWDFSLGYPTGFGEILARERNKGCKSELLPPWRAVWNEISQGIVDDDSNKNNRFEFAASINRRLQAQLYWGCPRGREIQCLSPKSTQFPTSVVCGGVTTKIQKKRHAEKYLKGTQECWKLLGVGSVGSQSLTGIPYVNRLRDEEALQGCSVVWPFESNFDGGLTNRQRSLVVHTEVWPGLVKEQVTKIMQEAERERRVAFRDEVQVLELGRFLMKLDSGNELATWFVAPAFLDEKALTECVESEGWILLADN